MQVGNITIDDSLNDLFTIKYIKPRDLLLAWNKRDIYVNGSYYKDTIGIRIKPNSREIVVGLPMEKRTKIMQKGVIATVDISRNDKGYLSVTTTV